VRGSESPSFFVTFNFVAPESENSVVVEVAPGSQSSPEADVSESSLMFRNYKHLNM
jgi:hypothetical protein